MSAKDWLALCLLALFAGGIVGWGARACTNDHRYIRSLAERHEAEGMYYMGKLADQIKENQKIYGRDEHGAKKN